MRSAPFRWLSIPMDEAPLHFVIRDLTSPLKLGYSLTEMTYVYGLMNKVVDIIDMSHRVVAFKNWGRVNMTVNLPLLRIRLVTGLQTTSNWVKKKWDFRSTPCQIWGMFP